jgi:sirohydrochlorin cobaltochelatase
MTLFPEQTGLLVVGHGSREEVGVREFLATADRMRSLLGHTPVEPCFLEFAEPSIGAGFRRLVARDVRRVIVAPVLLFAAGHAKQDIPNAVREAAAQAAGVTTRQAEHLGAELRLLALSHQRFAEALARAQTSPRDLTDTLLVLVGRGSHDPQATAQMLAFAQARAAGLSSTSTPPAAIEVAFVAMAEPRLTDLLERAAAGPPRRIVVQPHLLFGGVLLDRIAEIVRDAAARHPQHQWISTEHLGPHPLVAEALLARAAEASAAD